MVINFAFIMNCHWARLNIFAFIVSLIYILIIVNLIELVDLMDQSFVFRDMFYFDRRPFVVQPWQRIEWIVFGFGN